MIKQLSHKEFIKECIVAIRRHSDECTVAVSGVIIKYFVLTCFRGFKCGGAGTDKLVADHDVCTKYATGESCDSCVS